MPTLIKSNWPRIPRRHMEKMLDGSMTCFVRCQQLLNEGDIFEVFGAQFRITKVEEGILEEIWQRLWAQAGYNSYSDWVERWMMMQKDSVPTQQVWIHFIEKV